MGERSKDKSKKDKKDKKAKDAAAPDAPTSPGDLQPPADTAADSAGDDHRPITDAIPADDGLTKKERAKRDKKERKERDKKDKGGKSTRRKKDKDKKPKAQDVVAADSGAGGSPSASSPPANPAAEPRTPDQPREKADLKRLLRGKVWDDSLLTSLYGGKGNLGGPSPPPSALDGGPTTPNSAPGSGRRAAYATMRVSRTGQRKDGSAIFFAQSQALPKLRSGTSPEQPAGSKGRVVVDGKGDSGGKYGTISPGRVGNTSARGRRESLSAVDGADAFEHFKMMAVAQRKTAAKTVVEDLQTKWTDFESQIKSAEAEKLRNEQVAAKVSTSSVGGGGGGGGAGPDASELVRHGLTGTGVVDDPFGSGAVDNRAKHLVNPLTFGHPEIDYTALFGFVDVELPGTTIWIMENWEPRELEPEMYGRFYSRDCYIVLNVSGFDDAKVVRCHHWHGKEATFDKGGTAAIRTTELNTYLGGQCRIFREEEGSETPQFLSYFEDETIETMYGGSEPFFKSVQHYEYPTRFYQLAEVPGGKYYLRLVKQTNKVVNTTGVFILDTGLKIFQWNGSQTKPKHRQRASHVVARINNYERGGLAQIVILEEVESDPMLAYELNLFWNYLGGEVTDLKQDNTVPTKFVWDRGGLAVTLYGSWDWKRQVPMVEVPGEDDLFEATINLEPGVYQFRYKVATEEGLFWDDDFKTGDPEIDDEPIEHEVEVVLGGNELTQVLLYKTEISEGKMDLRPVRCEGVPKQELLDSRSCYIVDADSELFIWEGRRTTKIEKKLARALAHKFLQFERPEFTPIIPVFDSAEPITFREKFADMDHMPLPPSDLTTFYRTLAHVAAVPQQDPRRINFKALLYGLSSAAASMDDVLSGAGKKGGAGGAAGKDASKDPLADLPASASEEERRAALVRHQFRAAGPMIDDGTGVIDCWECVGYGPQFNKLPKEERGIFYRGSSYLVLYTYLDKSDYNQQKFMAYMWDGMATDQHRAFSMFTLGFQPVLRKRMGDALSACHVREQEEPPHFHAVFGGAIVLKNGVRPSGVDDHLKGMFRCSLAADGRCWVSEVDEMKADRLNSASTFVVRSRGKTFVWTGRHSSAEEQAIAQRLGSTRFDSDKDMTVFEEGNEFLKSFWRELGGEPDRDAVRRRPGGRKRARLFRIDGKREHRYNVVEVETYTQATLRDDEAFVLLTARSDVFTWQGDGTSPFLCAWQEMMVERLTHFINKTRDEGDPVAVVAARQRGDDPLAPVPDDFAAEFPSWTHGLPPMGNAARARFAMGRTRRVAAVVDALGPEFNTDSSAGDGGQGGDSTASTTSALLDSLAGGDDPLRVFDVRRTASQRRHAEEMRVAVKADHDKRMDAVPPPSVRMDWTIIRRKLLGQWTDEDEMQEREAKAERERTEREAREREEARQASMRPTTIEVWFEDAAAVFVSGSWDAWGSEEAMDEIPLEYEEDDDAEDRRLRGQRHFMTNAIFMVPGDVESMLFKVLRQSDLSEEWRTDPERETFVLEGRGDVNHIVGGAASRAEQRKTAAAEEARLAEERRLTRVSYRGEALVVQVMGSWDDWADSKPLVEIESDVFEIKLELPKGTYELRLKVASEDGIEYVAMEGTDVVEIDRYPGQPVSRIEVVEGVEPKAAPTTAADDATSNNGDGSQHGSDSDSDLSDDAEDSLARARRRRMERKKQLLKQAEERRVAEEERAERQARERLRAREEKKKILEVVQGQEAEGTGVDDLAARREARRKAREEEAQREEEELRKRLEERERRRAERRAAREAEESGGGGNGDNTGNSGAGGEDEDREARRRRLREKYGLGKNKGGDTEDSSSGGGDGGGGGDGDVLSPRNDDETDEERDARRAARRAELRKKYGLKG